MADREVLDAFESLQNHGAMKDWLDAKELVDDELVEVLTTMVSDSLLSMIAGEPPGEVLGHLMMSSMVLGYSIAEQRTLAELSS